MALEAEILAFDAKKAELGQHRNGKWVVFHGDDFVGAFDTLDNAAAEAAFRFGRGALPHPTGWIAPLTLPASVLYHPVADIAGR